MKRILPAIFLAMGLLTASTINAQEGAVDKKPLIEIFTSSTCPPCVMGNTVVDAVLANNQGLYTLIKYQMNWPGEGDPYYMDASGVRRNYYSVSGVPHIRTNGFSPGYPQTYTQGLFSALLPAKTNMSVTGTAAVSTETPGNLKTGNEGLIIDCHVELKAHAAYEAGLKAYIMIVEGHTFGNASTNGETMFNNVVQGYVLSSEGEVLEAMAADETKSFDLSIDLTGSNTETGNDLSMVVFVQDPGTMDIIQSEMVEVSHNFIDYSASFDIYDEDFNVVKGGTIDIAMAGGGAIIDSKASASKLFPGTYEFEIVVPGLLPYEGEFTINDSDLHQEIFIEIPPFLFYEDFENPGFPENWTFFNPQGDYLAQSSGQIVYQKTQEGAAVYIILPKIKIDQSSILSFKVGNSFGRSDVGVGIVSSTTDPGSSYSEIVSYEIYNIEGMRTFGARLDDPSIVGDGYICLKYTATNGNYFYMDNFLIIENQPGYKVQFMVKDQNDQILPEVEVVMIDEGISTNTFGCATWRNVDPGNYNYAISYQGVEFETGTIDVDGDVMKEVVYNTSGIIDFVQEETYVYPNPATDQITLKGINQGSIKIQNLEGKVLLEQRLEGQSEISITELPVGVYLVKITSAGKELTQKLLKTR